MVRRWRLLGATESDQQCWGSDPRPGLVTIARDEWRIHPVGTRVGDFEENYAFHSVFTGWQIWLGYFPQHAGGRATAPATHRKEDPCEGVTSSDLRYDKVRRYRRNRGMGGRGRYIHQTAEQHIRSRHMNAASGASQYFGSFGAVRNTNAYTFNFGTRTTDSTGRHIYFELNFRLPIVGTDRNENFKPTSYNTLILESDCRTVVTSHPGTAWQ